VSEESFPSGPWTGFYNYNFRRVEKHRMDLSLAFVNGSMTGEGIDDVGRFLIKGRYDSVNGECYWTKSYIGAHDVFYRGFSRWAKAFGAPGKLEATAVGDSISGRDRLGECERATASAEAEAPVDAVAAEAASFGGKRWEAVETASASPNLRTPG